MTTGPLDSHGIGTPSDAHPGFAPPAGPPGGPPAGANRVVPGQQQPPWPQAPQAGSPQLWWPTPGQPQPRSPLGWSAPDPRLLVPPPPSGRGPRHPQGRRVRMVAALVAASLVLIGILGALPLLSPAPQPQPSATAPTSAPLVTVTPSVSPGSTSTATSGGDLGKAIAFRTAAGTGTVTIHSAIWTDSGEMAPPSGQRYLVVDATVACSQGDLPVDALMFLAVTGEGKSLPAFGPTLASPLAGQVVKAGVTARGQVGYVLTAGPVTLDVLDADLHRVAEIRIPAP